MYGIVHGQQGGSTQADAAVTVTDAPPNEQFEAIPVGVLTLQPDPEICAVPAAIPPTLLPATLATDPLLELNDPPYQLELGGDAVAYSPTLIELGLTDTEPDGHVTAGQV